MSHLSKIYHFIILDANPITIEYKNNTKQRNLNTVFANISTKKSLTSDSFLLIMSQMTKHILKSFLLPPQVPCAFSKDPIYTFNDRPDVKHFAVENRSALGDLQDLNALAQYMKQFDPAKFHEAMLDFHLLIFLATMEMLPLKVGETKIDVKIMCIPHPDTTALKCVKNINIITYYMTRSREMIHMSAMFNFEFSI